MLISLFVQVSVLNYTDSHMQTLSVPYFSPEALSRGSLCQGLADKYQLSTVFCGLGVIALGIIVSSSSKSLCPPKTHSLCVFYRMPLCTANTQANLTQRNVPTPLIIT